MQKYLHTAILAGAVALLWLVHFILPALPDPGDGVYHYQIARFSWQHPELLLDHWGKPLFTILSSPFAQFGFSGMVLFNLILFAISAYVLNKAIGPRPWSLPLIMIFLLFSPMYLKMIYAGMTEILFSTVAVVSVALVYKKRFIAGAIAASFLPYCRPEYIVLMPLLAIWISYQKQWKALPFLALGSVLFALFGCALLEDPLWYIHNNPYTGAEDIYGSGSLWHFVKSSQQIWGLPFISLFLMGVCCMFLSWREERAQFLFILSFGTATGVLFVHSLLWWQGERGSLGLVRVIATVVPLMIPLVLLGGDYLLKLLVLNFKFKWTGLAAVSLFLLWGCIELKNQHPLPTSQGATEHMLEEAAAWLGEHRTAGHKVSYLYPYFGYAADLDPYNEEETWLIWGLDQTHPTLGLSPGDWVVWDAHFGPNEGKLDLSQLSENEQFTLKKVIYPPEAFKVLGGRIFEVYIYQVAPRPEKETLHEQVGLLEEMKYPAGTEYVNLFRDASFYHCNGVKQMVWVKGGVKASSAKPNSGFQLCFTQRKEGEVVYHRSINVPVTPDWTPLSIYFEVDADIGVSDENVIYILNPEQIEMEVAGVSLTQKCSNW
jgi:hypothetical protein